MRDFVTDARTRINAALGVLESVGAIGRAAADRLFCDKAKLAQAARMDTTLSYASFERARNALM